MSARREQLDKPTFKGPKQRKRWSYREAKTAFNRTVRRAAKRDPEDAPRKREFHGWYW